MFGYLPGGYGRMLDRFAQVLTELDVKIKVGYRATEIKQTSKGIEIKFSNGQEVICDRVILTIPASITAKICPGLTDSEKLRLNDIQYQGIICASLLLKKPLANFYVTNITDDWVPFTGVIEMTTLVNPQQFGGHTLVYLPKLTDEQLQSQFWQALKRMYPQLQDSDLLTFRVSRVKQVLAIATLNYSQKLPSMNTSIPGLYVINSAQICNGTLNVNETIKLAKQGTEYLRSQNQSKKK